jgi:hypothetical protein
VIRKTVYLCVGEDLLKVGEAADWDEVMDLVHAYLHHEGYDDSLYLSIATSVERDDHYVCELTVDA